MTIIQFTVPGAPVGKGRPKVSTMGGKFARMYTPQKTASYEGLVAHCARQVMGERKLLTVPVCVELNIDLPIPASWSKKKQAAARTGAMMPTKKPDMDNVIKAIFDALNHVVWNDDVQVVDLFTRKRYSDKPGVTVSVCPMAGKVAA